MCPWFRKTQCPHSPRSCVVPFYLKIHILSKRRWKFSPVEEDGGGGVACERWNWQIPPISTAADASRDNRVRHLLHCRTVECLP